MLYGLESFPIGLLLSGMSFGDLLPYAHITVCVGNSYILEIPHDVCLPAWGYVHSDEAVCIWDGKVSP